MSQGSIMEKLRPFIPPIPRMGRRRHRQDFWLNWKHAKSPKALPVPGAAEQMARYRAHQSQQITVRRSK